MTAPWNSTGTATTTPEAPAPQQAWQHAPQPQQPAGFGGPAYGAPSGPQPYGPPQFGAPESTQPTYGSQFGPQGGYGPGGMPPAGTGFGGPGFPGGPGPKKNATLIISLVVAAVLLIGGGVTAFLMLSKKDTTPAPAPAASTSTAPSVGAPSNPTKTTPTSDGKPTEEPGDTPATPTRTNPAPTQDDPIEGTETGGADMATAEGLVQNWLGFVNEGDVETASQLICQAEQQDFIDGFAGVTTPANQLEAVDMQWDGDNIALTLGAVGDTTGQSQIELTMWPTDTGYFLICSSPLSQADLNW